MSTDVSVAVIGGGQAGLATSYWLKQSDVDHVVMESGASGDTWRKRWDSFCLVTPNWTLNLPGLPYSGSDPDGFLPRDKIVEYVERYREFVDPPMHTPVEVRRASRDNDGWLIATDRGDHRADKVVVATGSFQTPSIPPGAISLSEDILQIHSSEYRSPDAMPEGAILVVGSGQSGCQIVDDLRQAGRETWLSVGGAIRFPRRYRARDTLLWLKEIGFMDLPMSENPQGPDARYAPNPHVSGRDGGKDMNLREFGESGVRLVGRFSGVSNSTLHFEADLEERLEAADEADREIRSNIDAYIEEAGINAPVDDQQPYEWAPGDIRSELDVKRENITSVVWATGFGRDYSWIEGLRTDHHGYPIEERGVTDLPGLYFVGLHGMYTIGSGLFYGVGDDARYVVEHLR